MIRRGDLAIVVRGQNTGAHGTVEDFADDGIITVQLSSGQTAFCHVEELVFEPVDSPAQVQAPAPHRKVTDSTRDDWRTPPQIFHTWRERFNFDLDAAASPANKLCAKYFAPLKTFCHADGSQNLGYQGDAFAGPWPDGAKVWLNPPYSQCKEFAAAAIANSSRAQCIVLLVPSATDTRYWHSLAKVSQEVWFSRGRVSFLHPEDGHPVNGNPVGSTIFVISGHQGRPPYMGTFDAKTGAPLGVVGKNVFGAFQLHT